MALFGAADRGTGDTLRPDLQAWTRDAALDPDWLRVGTDIVVGTQPVVTFNAAFTLDGETVPEPAPVALLLTALALLGLRRRA